MNEIKVSELDVQRPVNRRTGVGAGGEVADADVRKENLLAQEADGISTAFTVCTMTADITSAVGEVRRKRRCRRKRKAGEHHRGPASEEPDSRRCRQSRTWKPYTDMTWEERCAKDELQANRAARRRDKRFASGQAMAPDNTTQFLMEQYDVDKTRILPNEGGQAVAGELVGLHRDFGCTVLRPRSPESTATGESTSAAVDGDDDDEDRSVQEEMFFLEREFNEAYNRQLAERLEGMTKDELIRDYIQIETIVERLQSRGGSGIDAVSKSNATPLPEMKLFANINAIELRHLQEENARLVRENSRLRLEMKARMTAASVLSTPGPE